MNTHVYTRPFLFAHFVTSNKEGLILLIYTYMYIGYYWGIHEFQTSWNLVDWWVHVCFPSPLPHPSLRCPLCAGGPSSGEGWHPVWLWADWPQPPRRGDQGPWLWIQSALRQRGVPARKARPHGKCSDINYLYVLFTSVLCCSAMPLFPYNIQTCLWYTVHAPILTVT